MSPHNFRGWPTLRRPAKPSSAFIHRTISIWLNAQSQTSGGSVGQSTIAGPSSYDIACLAVGGTTAAIRDVMSGAVCNAYALTRPPGHHAERDRGRGFCIFNNIALAILEARAQGWADRVAVMSIGMCTMATARNKRFLRTPMSSPSPSIKRCSTR